MKYTRPIRKNSAFRYIYAHGVSVASRLLVLYTRKNDLEINRLGITVGKKVGGAVVRNRVKRLIKESFRLTEERIVTGYDIIFVARAAAGALKRQGSFKAVDLALKSLLEKQGMLK